MTATLNHNVTDVDLKNDILSELKYEPSVHSNEIGVIVKDGTVTLNGFTSTYWEKYSAVRAAKRVVGVNAIADDIEVRLPGSLHRTDGDIAHEAGQQLTWAPSVPNDAVKVTVRNGWLNLEGDVEWWYQKNAAENAVHYLLGVKGVTNDINIKPKLSAMSIEDDIQAAFKRSAYLDGDEVTVTTAGSSVTLRGKVRTFAEKEEADRVAWAAAGVMSVLNELTVTRYWMGTEFIGSQPSFPMDGKRRLGFPPINGPCKGHMTRAKGSTTLCNIQIPKPITLSPFTPVMRTLRRR